MFSPQNDSLVKDITLFNKNPIALRGYAAPFALLYLFGASFWIKFFGIEHYESAIVIGSVITLLHILTLLFCFWSVDVNCWLACSKGRDPQTSSYAKVSPTANNGSKELVPIHKSKEKIWIEFQKVHYIYDSEEKKVFQPVNFPVNESFEFYQNWKGYKEEDDIKSALESYGNNEMEMVIPDFRELFQERATAPFFVFQVFCVGLWCLDEYWYYSVFTLFMLVAFEASLVYQQIRNMSEIRKMGNKPCMINVYRNRKWRSILSTELIAGDVISLSRPKNDGDRLVPCDCLLLRGRMIVDESMLTGESIPQMKEPIEDVDSRTVLDHDVHSRLHVISGGTRIVQHTPPPKSSTNNSFRPSDNGCVAYILQTGFNTSQGKLLRTILFGVKRVTANNLETFGFILFLLIFAIAASGYVWVKGTEDPTRSRYKLMLNCTLILTSVVPPELPIELSLAVNSSLLALSKLHVFCTEPFRIPFAGKVDVCCFDKTGTLTSDSLVVEGIAGIDSCEGYADDGVSELCPVLESPLDTQKVLASCHALVNMDDEMIGDPLEQTMLKSVEWNLTKSDVMIPRKKIHGAYPLKIVQRFHFSSVLKRMSVVASFDEGNSSGLTFLTSVKGAAETLKPMLIDCPVNYDECHQSLSRRGARVLALGIKTIGSGLTHQQVRDLKREDVEKDLRFAGFVIVSSPLKPDSKAIIREIKSASHNVTMITGDNPLTACFVAKVLKFTTKRDTLILTKSEQQGCWSWNALHSDDTHPLTWKPKEKLSRDLCVTGEGMSFLISNHYKFWLQILPSIRVFARVKPKQKETVITTLKEIGLTVLMCGDGTNDVGALKHAHVGVALLSNPPMRKPPTNQTANSNGDSQSSKSSARPPIRGHEKGQPRSSTRNRAQQKQDEMDRRKQKMDQLMKDVDEPSVVKLGDASIASPFTYKLSSIIAVCHIIKQGRCTLVTTLQMFKILAINALILAYSQSVLYLDGIKFGDMQATLQGLLLAGCFLFISRSKPLKVLSRERPLPNIFNFYTILTVTLQFAVHFVSLFFVVMETKRIRPREDIPDLDADFAPNLLNTTVYIISVAMQINTFAINYWGNPFMENLRENKALGYSLLASVGFLVAILFGVMPEVNQQFQVVDIPTEFQYTMLLVLIANFGATWLIDRFLRLFLGSGKLH